MTPAEKKTGYPKREEFQWRPAPILCKRFDLVDPFMGKVNPLLVVDLHYLFWILLTKSAWNCDLSAPAPA